MKVIALLAVILTSLATAGIKLPSKSFPIGKLEEAKAIAQERGKPLIFVDT